LRHRVKRAIERMLVASGAAALARFQQAPSTAILAYHGVVPDGASPTGDVSLHISRSRFAEHLDRVMESHDVVPLTEVFPDDRAARGGAAPARTSRRRPTGGRSASTEAGSARARCVLTFDDAYLGAMTVGLEEVRRRGLCATVFVSPGLLGSEGFWWDRLAPTGGAPLEPDVRTHALERLGGRQGAVLDWARREGRSLATLPDWARPASPERLDEEVAKGGVTLGAHMWTHPNMAAGERDDLRRELARTTAWLEERRDVAVPWLAYPYGLHDAGSVAVARGAVAGALRVDGGLAERGGRMTEDRYRVPRINVPSGLSADGLALRMAGIGGWG